MKGFSNYIIVSIDEVEIVILNTHRQENNLELTDAIDKIIAIKESYKSDLDLQ